MHVLASVILENFLDVRRGLRAFGPPPPGAVGSRQKPPPAVIAQMGGRLLLIDWDAGRIVKHLPLFTAAGICWPSAPAPLLVASGWGAKIFVVDPRTGAVTRELSHPVYNHLHSVTAVDANGGAEREDARYLITCSGTDAIHEIDRSGAPLWSWWGFQHGYLRTPDGVDRVLDPAADHRPIEYPTLTRAVHPNSAIPDPEHEGAILSTFFHASQLVRIDRASGATTVLRDDLDHPHELHRLDAATVTRLGLPAQTGYLVSDSHVNTVRALDRESFADTATFTEGLQWVQDAIPCSRGTLLVADVLHIGGDNDTFDRGNRLTEIDARTGRPQTICEVSQDWRLFDLLELSEAQAEACAAWPDFPADAEQRWLPC